MHILYDNIHYLSYEWDLRLLLTCMILTSWFARRICGDVSNFFSGWKGMDAVTC
jgi:hypothetical protein